VQVPGESGAIGSGALDADGDEVAVGAKPVQEPVTAVGRGADGLGGQVPADRVDHGGLDGGRRTYRPRPCEGDTSYRAAG